MSNQKSKFTRFAFFLVVIFAAFLGVNARRVQLDPTDVFSLVFALASLAGLVWIYRSHDYDPN
jgi:hypothetical protein